MLSGGKFHFLLPPFEVFFDLRPANRVPKRLKVTLFYSKTMAEFYYLMEDILGDNNLTTNCNASLESSTLALSSVLHCYFTEQQEITL